MSKSLSVFWQYLLPQHWLSRLIGKLAHSRWPWLKNQLITHFIQRYQVDMSQALEPDPTRYADFNAFFTRALKPGIRRIDDAPYSLVSPVDGCVSQVGRIQAGRIFQAKNFYFSLVELLGGSEARALPFWNGHFATFYLAPKDYHRVHMPDSGKLEEMVYVPGRLFSVNRQSVENISGIFARNERVINIFNTSSGAMAVILVGAMIVASIKTVWAGTVAPGMGREVQSWRYIGSDIQLNKGEEVGQFQLGSTVIVLMANSEMRMDTSLIPEQPILMGQPIGFLPN